MSLQARLDEMKAQFVENVDPNILEAMGKAKEDFDVESMLSGVARVGDKAPDFTLQDAGNQPVSASALWQRGPLLATFYRGVW